MKKLMNKTAVQEYNRQAYIRRKKRNADTAAGILTWRQVRQREYKTEGRTSPRKIQEPITDREKPIWQFLSVRDWVDTPEDREEVRRILERRAV